MENSIETEEGIYLIALSLIQPLNAIAKRKALEQFGNAYNTYLAFQEDAAFRQYIWPLALAEKEWAFAAQHQIQIIALYNDNYPTKLKQCEDAPILLFLKGNTNYQLPYLISIVGSRKHSLQVQKLVQELLEGLMHLPIGIISGLAIGVDGIVHQAALNVHLPTWCVLAHGLKQIYPPEHRSLAKQMLEQGGLFTEFSSETPPKAFHFPKRNRIVAGISDCTIVVESGIQGGSMITAGLARGYNRDVFAMPGRIHDLKSEGCLALIKSNTAALYHDPATLIQNMNWPMAPINAQQKMRQKISSNLKQTHRIVLLYIENQGPIGFDQLVQNLSISASELAYILVHLELEGYILKMAGNQFGKKLI